MSRLRIVYATKTRHSGKLARAIGNALNIQADNISDNPVLGETDMLFIVGGIYGGESLPELLAFAKNLDSGKIKSAALITSCVSLKQGQASLRKLLEDKGIPVVEEYICQGSFLLLKMGHPNKSDIRKTVDFAVGLEERITK